MSHSVIIKDIVKYYDDFLACNHISLTVNKGEFFTLLGPSGCGKTTLLRMIAGFNSVEGGDICFDDTVINDLPAHKRDIGMVFQNYAIFPHLTVEENIAYGLKARKISKSEMKERIREALQLVQIEHLRKRKINELSGGQQQRIALARAFVIKPAVLLMDEPLSNLDAKLRVHMRTVIRKLQKNLGITTIYVTHDQEEALAISDRLAVMKDGKVMQIGAPADIYKHPANSFVAGFIGVSNFIPCVIENNTIRINDSYALSWPHRSVFAGKANLSVRPEQLSLSDTGPGLYGNITLSTFLGDFVQHEVELKDGQIIEVNEYAKDGVDIRTIGSSVYITIDKSTIVLFDTETGEALL
ncbi:ABC transporter ATP-binding protein [Treponema sp. Marseille-Q4523]|uniref:ABC transporter ATP-binding protein n=1 Tax=Treponema sp. Marseille-Q4523 TaxID=2810610 RepID=UPI00196017A6|nr:ABC transporter ATP-binding protein [Treponema sp. Marseille-Q4523]MBM7023645.1 ABC transporter ATP-binding protein [Treponema sp. Marseille-Q4523]